ncbi:hypothetical protein ABPG74_022533 [Tetrahymena malaccensis]
MSKCKNLTGLCLCFHENNFDDDSLYELSSGISKCLNLQQFDIDLRKNQITLAGATSLAQSLLNCIALQNFSVDLMQCSNGKQTSCAEFGFYIAQHQNLRNLKFNFNESFFSPKNIEELSQELKNMKNLISLNIQYTYGINQKVFTRINNARFLDILNNLQDCQQLQQLNLDFSSNSIGDKFIIFDNLNFKQLTTLNLNLSSNSSFGENESSNFFDLFNKIHSLQDLKLNLSNNQLSIKNIQSLGNSLKINQNIQKLHLILNNCKLRLIVAKILFTQLGQCTQLNSLCINLDLFSETEDEKNEQILAKLKSCTKLQNLSLTLNNVELDINEIPHFKNLQSLNLHLNYHDITEFGSLGTALRQLQLLSSLSLKIWTARKIQIVKNQIQIRKILKIKRLVQYYIKLY